MVHRKPPTFAPPPIPDSVREAAKHRLAVIEAEEKTARPCADAAWFTDLLERAREIRDPVVQKLFVDLLGLLEMALNRPQVAIIVGWKDICAALGGISSKTARRWVANEGLPIVAVNGTPTLSPEALRRWHETLKIKQSAR